MPAIDDLSFGYRALGSPASGAIAQRFSGVLGMLSSLEVKVLYPT